MSYAEDLSRKYGWPLKIHSRGYDAYLVDQQPLNGEPPAAIYRFPGDDSVVFESEIRASKETADSDKSMIELFAKKQRSAQYPLPRR